MAEPSEDEDAEEAAAVLEEAAADKEEIDLKYSVFTAESTDILFETVERRKRTTRKASITPWCPKER